MKIYDPINPSDNEANNNGYGIPKNEENPSPRHKIREHPIQQPRVGKNRRLRTGPNPSQPQRGQLHQQGCDPVVQGARVVAGQPRIQLPGGRKLIVGKGDIYGRCGRLAVFSMSF